MAPNSNIASESNTGHHCPTCTCVSHDVSHDILDSTACSPSSKDDSRLLDDEIDRVSNVLAALKRRQNARQPVARIPPELLSEIFLYFRDASIPSETRHWKTYPWISIVHVSTGWRSVALDDPRLWNILNLRFPDLVRQLLTRLAAMPLYVVLSRPKPAKGWPEDAEFTGDPGLGALLETNNLIHSLETSGPIPETMLVLQALLPRAADHLVHLTIDFAECRAYVLRILEDTRVPNLQYLSLATVWVFSDLSCPFLTSCWGSLRELRLRECIAYGVGWKALESFVSLEKLSLSDTSSVGTPKHATGMTNLTELYLEEEPLVMLDRLKAFGCSPDCNITICLHGRQFEWAAEIDPDYDPLIIYISSAHRDPTRARITKDFVELRYGGDAHYTYKYICDAQRRSTQMLGALLPKDTTALSITCDPDVTIGQYDLEVLSKAVKGLCSITICGRPFVVALDMYLSEDTSFLPMLSLIQLCDCCAALEGQLSQKAQLRERLNVHVGGIELCSGVHNMTG